MKPTSQTLPAPAFTLIELLLSIALLTAIMTVVLSMVSMTGSIWQSTAGKIAAFQEARNAFESMTRKISQATLNTYWDYDNSANPTRYLRKSELHFVSGKASSLLGGNTVTHSIFFQAPLGFAEASPYKDLENILNSTGYFVEYSDDTHSRPDFLRTSIPSRYRYRLFEFNQPSENTAVYSISDNTWFTQPLTLPPTTRPIHPIAENIITLIILPSKSSSEDPSGSALSPDFEYDSRNDALNTPQPAQAHQLPPLVHVAIIAIDDISARRWGNSAAPPNLGLDSLFQNAADLDSDLATLATLLNSGSDGSNNIAKPNWRLFQTDVAVRGAKWSQ